MNARAIRKFLAGASNDLFEQRFGLYVFLLLKMLQRLFVELKLLLDSWIGDRPKRLGLGLRMYLKSSFSSI